MTALAPPRPTTPTSNNLPGSASGSPEFQSACARRDYGLLQEAIADLTTRDAVDHLAELFPHRSRRWFHRNYRTLMDLPPDLFWRAMHADPTGDTAARNIDDQRTTQRAA